MGVTESNNSEKSESLSGGTSMSLVNEGHPGVALSPRSSSRYDDRRRHSTFIADLRGE